MQAFTQQQLIHLLQLAEGKSAGKESESDGGLIEPALDGPGRGFDHGPLTRRQRWKVGHLKPGVTGAG